MLNNKWALLFWLAIFVGGGVLLLNSISSVSQSVPPGPCTGLTYRFGKIDPHYNINKKQLRTIMKDVARLWSDATGQQLVQYSDTGEVAINFIYSEIQQFTESEQQLSNRIKNEKRQFEQLKQKFQLLSGKYKTRLNKYNRRLEEFNKAVDKYNNTVSEMNKKGVISKSEEQQMEDRKKQIQRMKTSLDRELQQLNQLRDKVNRMSDRLDALSNRYNILTTHYNRRFGKQKEFDQGNYIRIGDERKINIYQFDNIDNLRLVLAHEVGHALGLDHVDNPKSIMYYLMDQQDEENLQLTNEDIAAIRRVCNN